MSGLQLDGLKKIYMCVHILLTGLAGFALIFIKRWLDCWCRARCTNVREKKAERNNYIIKADKYRFSVSTSL